jgi:hypothetical protein
LAGITASIHLRNERAHGQRLLQRIEQSALIEKTAASLPARSRSSTSAGIAGSLRRDIVGLLLTHYARPHMEILTFPAQPQLDRLDAIDVIAA